MAVTSLIETVSAAGTARNDDGSAKSFVQNAIVAGWEGKGEGLHAIFQPGFDGNDRELS